MKKKTNWKEKGQGKILERRERKQKGLQEDFGGEKMGRECKMKKGKRGVGG